ncbi:MAG: KpsF/GutQ family sugar-phosphate isomerase [Candidatus Neptunochlamydia sp.]|nr:KpsF/GutQ family sugar-phosphate isomerase [Candidatus Neptunochlamydia sp.]
MLKDLFEEYQRNLNYFFDQIETEKAENFFDLFLECEGMLIFTGVGKSGIIAEKLAMSMISTGTKALYLPPMNALHGDIGIVTKKDVLICISKSGESEELLSLVPYAQKKGAKTVAWVSNPQSKLLNSCDLGIYLPLNKELCPFDLAPTTSTAIQLIFGDVLSVALMKAKKFSLDEYALNHPAGSIGKKITLTVEDLMLRGEELPICTPNDRLREALVTLTDKKCGCLLIVDEKKSFRGIFTDGDLRRTLQKDPARMLEKSMGELMTPSCVGAEKGKKALEALKLMQKDPKKWVSVMPVVDSDRLIGLIRMHDFVQAGIV